MATTLDDKDRLIIQVLRDHAEYTTRQIAKKTILPITTVHHRIRKLRLSGVIKKYTIQLDYAQIGCNFLAYVMINANLQRLKEKKRTQHDLARDISRLPFIERVDIVSGGTDLIAIIRVSDVAEFDRVLLGRLQLLEGVDKTQSLIVLHSG